MKKISVVLSVYNEEKNIAACLTSVAWADEIIVVDNSSTDNTKRIAQKFTKKIITQKNNPHSIDLQKNTGITKATGEWIFILDADERVEEDLKEEIKSVIQQDNKDIQGYFIPRKNIIFQKHIQHSLWSPDYQLRLIRKGAGIFTQKKVHNQLEVTGKTAYLKNSLLHENYQTVSQYVYKMNTLYTESEAAQFVEEGKRVTWKDAIGFPVHDFLKTFFAQKGYKDGMHGLVLSLLQACYAEILFAKIWEKQGFTQYNSPHFLTEVVQEGKKLSREYSYWVFSSLMEQASEVKKIYYRLQRKLI